MRFDGQKLRRINFFYETGIRIGYVFLSNIRTGTRDHTVQTPLRSITVPPPLAHNPKGSLIKLQASPKLP